MQLHSASLDGWVQPADVFVQFFADESNAFWLDREHSNDDRFSVLGAGVPAAIDTLPLVKGTIELPFEWRPGLVGLLDYEGKPHFISAHRAVVFDHERQRLFFIGVFESKSDFDFWHHAALLRLGLSGGQVATYLRERPPSSVIANSTLLHEADAYLAMINEAQSHIVAGDVYQICLTNQIQVKTNADPLVTFLKLRTLNPAPYSTFLKLGDKCLVSSSPEQFIRVDKSGRVSTKPIKGTRARGADEMADHKLAEELRNDAKERAENLMIVDLMRNDLGKVSENGSVEVEKLFHVESYATVHQLVSTVSAQLLASESAWSATQAAFPGGSMTGAPKLRAMEIIQELEGRPRGFYSGCVGFLGCDGSAEFAMVIRSIVFEGEVATIGVGGGITIDSEPVAELNETKLKAKALLQALNAADPWA